MHNVSTERAVRAARQAEADLSATRRSAQPTGRRHESRPGTGRTPSTILPVTGAAGDVA